jgi:hypothetical protein
VIEGYYKTNEKAMKDYLNDNIGYTLQEWWEQWLANKDTFIKYI